MRMVDNKLDEGAPTEFDTGPSRADPIASDNSPQLATLRDPIAAAMSRLVAHIIEGFAAYAHAMYPSFSENGEPLNTWSETQAHSFRKNRLEMKSPGPYGNNPWVQDYPE